ncbi:MAG: translation elongation factor Ts [Planctomycetia bacterium]|nr:translation elongation factor Ts [Planctomycetia bacterium]
MSEISAAAVKSLRDRTNAPMMECKAALTEAKGNMDAAIDLLRKKLSNVAAGKAAREAAEGRVGAYIDEGKKVGAVVEVRCESAPVAKTEQFVKLADELARHIVAKNPASVEELMAQPTLDDPKKTVADRITDLVGLIRENMKVARFKRLEGLLGSYCHHDGSVGVLLQVEGKDTADAQLLRDVCMHITARSPQAARREDVPSATLDKEKEIARSQVAADPKNANKPANIVEKILEGKLNTWFADNVLVDQLFVKDDTKSVGAVLQGAGVKVVQFVRLKVGELT